MMYQLLVALALLSAVSGLPTGPGGKSEARYLVETEAKRAEVELVPGTDPGVSGHLTLTESTDGNGEPAIVIEGAISGLAPGLHGFHIHMSGNLTSQCKDAAAHFNPANNTHKGPGDSERHAGDLGNIEAPLLGPAPIYIVDKLITLGDGGPFDVAGRSFIVHEKEDDLGRGGDEESSKTGNAGARLACGLIQL